MATQAWNNFTTIPDGTRVLNHGWDQCVALANLYNEGVVGGEFVPVGSAYQWWTEFSRFDTLYRNYRQSDYPVAGALFVSRYGLYDAPNGHIGVVTSVNSDGSFNTMEQNAGTWRYVGRYTRDMRNMLGFLVPLDNPATESTPPPEPEKKERSNQMFIVFYDNAYPKDKNPYRWAITGPGYWIELATQDAANNIARQLGIHKAYVCKSAEPWNKFKAASEKGMPKK